MTMMLMRNSKKLNSKNRDQDSCCLVEAAAVFMKSALHCLSQLVICSLSSCSSSEVGLSHPSASHLATEGPVHPLRSRRGTWGFNAPVMQSCEVSFTQWLWFRWYNGHPLIGRSVAWSSAPAVCMSFSKILKPKLNLCCGYISVNGYIF